MTLRVLFAIVMLAQVPAHDPEWIAPPEAAGRTNPLAVRPETAPGGQKLFRHRCSTCHGEDGRGTNRGPDLTSAEVQGESDGALFWKIGSGNTRRDMPAFSFLPELQRWQLVLRLRALGKSNQSRFNLSASPAISASFFARVHRFN